MGTVKRRSATGTVKEVSASTPVKDTVAKDQIVHHGINVSLENSEFGGPWGAAFLIVWSHYILFYFYYCLEVNQGKMIFPLSLDEAKIHVLACLELLANRCIPSSDTWVIYTTFFVATIVLAAFSPGVVVMGLPISPGHKLKCEYEDYFVLLLPPPPPPNLVSPVVLLSPLSQASLSIPRIFSYVYH